MKRKRSTPIVDTPPYRSIVAIREVAYHYEIPNNSENFIWHIPSRYTNPTDREISALCCSWIYDGSRHSLKAAWEMDSWFGGSPSRFLFSKEYNDIIIQQQQTKVLHKSVTVRHCFYLFQWLNTTLSRLQTFRHSIELSDKPTPYEATLGVLREVDAFNGKTTNSTGRINLFLFMMAHCFDDYKLDASQLRPPLFEHHVIPTCRALHLLDKKDKKTKWVEKVYNYLVWFSRNNPMTFWVGIMCYKDFVKNNPKAAGKFASMHLIRHSYRKK